MEGGAGGAMMGNGTWVPFTAASSEMNGTGLAPGGSAAAPAPADVVMSEPSTSQPAGAATTAEKGTANGLVAQPEQADPSAAAPKAVAEPKDPLLEAFEAQQQAVTADPGDFNKWVNLISASEKLADITKIRQVYDAFFLEYPLCFGYWKKYADAEQRHNSTEAAVQVYERGVAAVAYSADLWGHYAVFKQNAGFTSGAVISVFERGAQTVGRDPGAHGFWDKYIRYAESIKEQFRTASIYKRALGQPLKQLDKYMSGVTEFVEQHSVSELYPVQSERAALEAAAKRKKEADAEAAKRAAAEAQAAAAAAAASAAAEAAAAAAAAQAEAPPAAPAAEAPPLIGPPEAPRPPEAMAAAPQTPPPSSEATLFVPPAPGAPPAGPGDHVGPVTPPPSSSTPLQTHPSSAQVPAAQNGSADGGAPSYGEAGAGQDSAAAGGTTAPTRGEAGPVKLDQESASEAEPQPMQADSAAAASTDDLAVSEADVKEAWLATCKSIYEATKQEVTRRKAFEDALRRPYFHVKPLEAGQLAAWSGYLDYMDAKGDEIETRHMFERCLVACARYPEFWMRYVRYLEPRDVPAAKRAMRRGQTIHCKAISEMQLFAARFHERHGDLPEARAAHEVVSCRLAPGLISAILARANFERRQGSQEAACAVYEAAIAAAAEKLPEDDKPFVHLTIQYAQFLLVVYRDAAGARAAYAAALEKLPRSQALWEGAIHLEQVVGAPVEEVAKAVLGLFQRAITSAELLPSDKEDLSARACTFADMFGSAAMQEATERLHAARVKLAADASASSASAKRPAETSEVHSPSKQARTASTAYPAAYPTAAPAAAYSAAPYAPPAAPTAAPVASAAGYYGQPAAGYQYPGYAYPGYGQPGYPNYSYPQY